MIYEPEIQALLQRSIFKFGPQSHVGRALEKMTLGFSSLSNFNDIYEPEYRLTHFFHSLEDEKTLLDPIDNTLHKIQELAKEFLSSVRVTCFSRSPLNNLMWAHYAENHKGVCYCFDFENSQSPLVGDVSWGNVIYSSLVPEIKVFQDQTTEGMLPTLLSDVVLTKSQDWSYEQEVRFYRSEVENKIEFNPEKLSAIIVGRRMVDEQLDQLRNSVAEYEKAAGHEVKVLFAHRNANSYSLGVHSNFGFRNGSEANMSIRIPVLDSIASPALTTLTKSTDNA